MTRLQWNSQDQELREGPLSATDQLCLDEEGDWGFSAAIYCDSWIQKKEYTSERDLAKCCHNYRCLVF